MSIFDSELNNKNLDLYVCNPTLIAKDYNKLSYDDLLEILRLNEKGKDQRTYDRAIQFTEKLIVIRNQERLVTTTWFLAIATIILAVLSWGIYK